ncbi:MAG: fluoride efflux transporter CrcB [Acutalibacteraceae bacterium]
MNILMVALGSAIGGVARYLLGLIPLPFKESFPFVTLFINFLGAFLIGTVAFWSAKSGNVNQNLILFLKVGLCGGFTTFSTFSLESYNLFQKGNISLALLYVVLSVLMCLLAVFCGKIVAENI